MKSDIEQFTDEIPSSSSESAELPERDSRAEPVPQPALKPEYVVGIGASAGGLEALQRFFTRMPADSGLAFVVIQHLSPDFNSLMNELLARHTRMRIYRVENGMPLAANAIYLIPPKKEMIVSGGQLLLSDKEPAAGLSLPIDIFFRSLARDQGAQAVAIILSGTGSDGSRGIVEVHEAGGLVIVQDEESAQFDGMLRSAIHTGVADLILPPDAMPQALANFVNHGEKMEAPSGLSPNSLAGQFEEIFARLRAHYELDFTYYKATTVSRRIERRMALRSLSRLDDYIRLLSDDRTELDTLYQDLLIGVTRFFRDPEAFACLEQQIIPRLVSDSSAQAPLRIWVAGCATGEEAYSLAMLLDEGFRKVGCSPAFKIFATDVHQGSLNTAAAGCYPESSLENLSPARRKRYFQPLGDQFQVKPELRRLIVFARHNVIKDPPFTKIDLISCRNMLIYLQPVAQKKALALFHFALRTDGTLLLGPSETLGQLEAEFHTLDAHWKFFAKKRDVRLAADWHFSSALSLGSERVAPPVAQVPRAGGEAALLPVYDAILARHMPAALLINERQELMHIFGDAHKYLQPASGRVNLNLLSMVGGDLRLGLAAAIQRAAKTGTPISYKGIRFQTSDHCEKLALLVEPLKNKAGHHTLITLEPMSPAAPAIAEESDFDTGEASQRRISELEQELQYTRENLQATVEELETSNEELQASNEELLASNEELQSTNEELHSVNEELYTVNAEYENKIKELTQLTNDMDNLLRSTDIGTVFLDRDLHIRKFTPAIAHTFNLLPLDIGRPIDHIRHNILDHDGLVEDLRQVLDSGRVLEQEVSTRQGLWLLMRIRPYRTEAGAVAGVVITFTDITDLRTTGEALRESEARFRAIFAAAGVGILQLDLQQRILHCNPAFQTMLGLEDEALDDLAYHDLIDGEATAEEKQLYQQLLAGERTSYRLEKRLRHRDSKALWGEMTVTLVRDATGQPLHCIAVVEDITALKEEELLRRERDLLDRIMETSPVGITVIDKEGQIRFANSRGESILGLNKDEFTRRRYNAPEWVVTDYEGNPVAPEDYAFSQVMAARQPVFDLEHAVQRPDGERVMLSVNAAPLFDEEGRMDAMVATYEDVTQRVRTEQALRRSQLELERRVEQRTKALQDSEARFRAIFESSRDCILVWDRNYNYLYANQASLGLVGSPREPMIGRNIRDGLGHLPAFMALWMERVDQIFASGKPLKVEDAIPVGEQVVYSESILSPIRDGDGRMFAVGVVYRDVTKRKRAEQKLQASLAELERSNNELQQFAYIASHDLQEPLRKVEAFSERIQAYLGEELDERGQDYLSRMVNATGRMRLLIDDLLAYSRVTTQAQPFVSVDLKQLVAEVLEDLEARIAESGGQVEVGPLPVIEADPHQLRQLFQNLIGNALKFHRPAEPAQVRVFVQPPERRADNPLALSPECLVEIRVADNGIGFDEKYLDRIFAPFQRLHRRGEFEGSGIGLAICRKVVVRHQGKLTAESQVGAGATFIVQLPLHQSRPESTT